MGHVYWAAGVSARREGHPRGGASVPGGAAASRARRVADYFSTTGGLCPGITVCGSRSRIRSHWRSSSSRSGPKSSGRSIFSKYSGSGPTQSEAITTRPSSVSTSSEIRPSRVAGRQDPAQAGLDLALLAGQLRSVRTMSSMPCSIAV